MQIYPAIDLRGGQCVRLRQGDYARETVYGHPADMAREWQKLGADYLHLVDLDGAKAGYPVNGDAIRAMKYAGRGGLAGSAVAGVGTYLAMGGNVHNEIRRIGLKQALQAAMADKVGMAHLSRHVGRGAAIGCVASLALTVPQLVREYRDRHASQSG